MLQHGFFDNGERLKSVLIIVNSQPIENIWFVADLQSRCKIASTCFGCSNVASEPRIAESIRFGENFELDLRAYALRRSGRPLKLERLPMELLILLVEQRGQLVTREEIIGRIWGKDVFLDTDNSINAAIRKIRQVLKDDPERPHFLQTVTGRGYRFIAPVEVNERMAAQGMVPPQTAAAEQLIGKRVSHYRVLQVLGGGGMGVVYKAEDLKLGRRVAIKFLPGELASDSMAFERLQREARAASSLDHPNICTIHELGEHEGQPFIVMQLLEGRTLREWIETAASESTHSRLAKLIEFAIQIAEGLEAAHQKGIIHRDIKPANIFITSREQVKILDFGVAKFVDAGESSDVPGSESGGAGRSIPERQALTFPDSNLTRTGVSMGTPSYLSPEQVRREKLDVRTDIFSFGLVLYEMATGRQTFPGKTVTEIRDAVLHRSAVPARQLNPELPSELEPIVSKALEKAREQRYQSAREIGSDLERLRRKHEQPATSGFQILRRSILAVIAWTFVLPLAAAAVALAIGASLWFQKTEYFWRNPIADARFQTVTDFDGMEQAAAVSRDGHFVAFLSDRDGQMDVWVTQVGSGQFHNLTRGSAQELVNPSVRALGFSPDGSFVTFWLRGQGSSSGDISIWAVPTLGGQPRPYLEGVAELDWSRDGSRLAYHTPVPGDPLFVSNGNRQLEGRPIFTAPPGLHSHFPLWAPDSAFIYLVQGSLPDKLDIWRIRPVGGTPERITSHNGRLTHPVLLDSRTLMYLASDPDGSGPWLYSMDVERRVPHRLSSGLDRYTSLAASADGRRLVVTLASPKRTLWRLRIADSPTTASAATPISLTTSTGSSPRLGPNYLLYVTATGTGESIWKLANETATELWRGQGAQVIGGPAIARWTVYHILGPATRAGALIRDAG